MKPIIIKDMIPNNCIDLVHQFLGTEEKQRFIYNCYIIPIIDVTTIYVGIDKDDIKCTFCYVSALGEGKKYYLCDFCIKKHIDECSPMTFSEFEKVNVDKYWKIFASCGFEFFSLVIQDKDYYSCFNKDSVNFEIKRGPLESLYSQEQLENLLYIMSINRDV